MKSMILVCLLVTGCGSNYVSPNNVRRACEQAEGQRDVLAVCERLTNCRTTAKDYDALRQYTAVCARKES